MITPQEVAYADLLRLMPQAPPILMVDRVLSYVKGHTITAIKCVSGLDPYFQGHFKDDNKVVPGLLLVEGIAQCAFLLAALGREGETSSRCEDLLISAEASFRAKVAPGDVVTYRVSFEHIDERSASFAGTACVGDVVAVRAVCASVRK